MKKIRKGIFKLNHDRTFVKRPNENKIRYYKGSVEEKNEKGIIDLDDIIDITILKKGDSTSIHLDVDNSKNKRPDYELVISKPAIKGDWLTFFEKLHDKIEPLRKKTTTTKKIWLKKLIFLKIYIIV